MRAMAADACGPATGRSKRKESWPSRPSATSRTRTQRKLSSWRKRPKQSDWSSPPTSAAAAWRPSPAHWMSREEKHLRPCSWNCWTSTKAVGIEETIPRCPLFGFAEGNPEIGAGDRRIGDGKVKKQWMSNLPTRQHLNPRCCHPPTACKILNFSKSSLYEQNSDISIRCVWILFVVRPRGLEPLPSRNGT